MAHFAEIDKDGVVQRVIVAEQDFIDGGAVGDPKNWVQTSYNTHGGIHRNGGTPLRKNFASAGFVYDKNRDAFIPPKPFDSWILNEEMCRWDAPKPAPDNGSAYDWDEKAGDWVLNDKIVRIKE